MGNYLTTPKSGQITSTDVYLLIFRYIKNINNKLEKLYFVLEINLYKKLWKSFSPKFTCQAVFYKNLTITCAASRIGFFFPRISDFSSHARKNKRGKKMCEKEESEKKTKKSEKKASISPIFKLCE